MIHECPDPLCDHDLTEGFWFGARCGVEACACESCRQSMLPPILKGPSRPPPTPEAVRRFAELLGVEHLLPKKPGK